MYLKEIEQAPPTPAAGRYGQAIASARAAGRAVPQIYHLFAHRPAAALALGDFMEEVMRGASELSGGERELIAAWTSARNDCLF